NHRPILGNGSRASHRWNRSINDRLHRSPRAVPYRTTIPKAAPKRVQIRLVLNPAEAIEAGRSRLKAAMESASNPWQNPRNVLRSTMLAALLERPSPISRFNIQLLSGSEMIEPSGTVITTASVAVRIRKIRRNENLRTPIESNRRQEIVSRT